MAGAEDLDRKLNEDGETAVLMARLHTTARGT